MGKIGLGVVGVGALAIACGSANASIRVWDWAVGDPGSYGISNTGGAFESIHAEFDESTKQFLWSVTFSNQITEGFTLAVNGGPNPKGHAGELALLYVDARVSNDVKIAAYAYNGKNSRDSWVDGDGNTAGNQPADFIGNLGMSGDILAATVDDLFGKRTISFLIDATDIIGHAPLYPDAVDPWTGVGFGEALGLWMHPYKGFAPTYGQDGRITALSVRDEGWMDGSDFDTDIKVPTPGTIALLGSAGLLGLK